MRSLSIQVQPERSPGIDMAALTQAFQAVAEMPTLVSHHAFDSGNDGGPYFNYTFGTPNARALWQTIQSQIYASPEFGLHMSRASMAMCYSESGWHTYSQLFHYDASVQLDENAL